jgi:hypothetical protein
VLEFLQAGENIVFVVALAVMLVIGLVELFGLGSAVLGHDLDFDAQGLDWLGFGRLPLLMLLVVFLAVFGSLGLIGQQFAVDHLGGLVSPAIMVPGAGVVALPLTGLAARLLGRIVPRDETTAIDIDRLVGLHAEIVVGHASIGNPAKARVRDFHGHAHYVMAEPDDPGQSFAEGDEILLVRRENNVFRAISSDRPAFTKWIEP